MARLIAGRYRLDDEIGAGGTSRVFSATDERLGRRVAVKQLTARAAVNADPAGHERFLREARTAASCLHPNAVTVFDAGEDDESLYMVMELVEGTTLASRLAGDALPLAEVARIADQVLAALAAAHELGIVHRDVKPANVLIRTDGTVKLTDFGIAKRFDDIEASITTTGLVLGTPRYLSPEQTLGREATPASDVYAAGLVMFEMLTGDSPVTGDTPGEVASAHQRQAVPDSRRLRPEVPAGVAMAISKALAKDPEERFADAAAFREVLAKAWHDAGVELAPLAVESGGVDARSSVPRTGAESAVGSATTVVEGPPTDVLGILEKPHPRMDRLAKRVPPAPLGLSAAIVFVIGFVLVNVSGGSDLAEIARGDGSLPSAAAEAGGGAAEIAAAPDLWTVLHVLENDPSVVGEAGNELLEGLRNVLATTDPAIQGEGAAAVRAAVAVWLADGHLDPGVGARVDELLTPVAAQRVEPTADDPPSGPGEGRGNGRGNGNGPPPGRGGGR